MSERGETVLACPVVVKRVAGLPAATLASSGEPLAATTRLEEAEAAFADTAQRAAEAIEQAVPRLFEQSRASANAAIAIKRALHNAREPRAKDLAAALPVLDHETAARIRAAIAALQAVADAQSVFESAYERELADVQAAAVDRIGRGDLAGAMRNSNPQLAARIERAARDPDSMKAKDLANARAGAVRQVARISLKTSPFAVYGSVGIGGWPGDGHSEATAEPTVRNQPNYGPIGHIVETLAVDFDRLGEHAVLRLNPSLDLDEGVLRWRRIENAPPSSRVRHVDMTSSASESAALKAVVAAFGASDRMAKDELVAAMRKMLPGQAVEKIDALLRSAFASQLIVCGAVYGQRPMVAARQLGENLIPELRDEYAARLQSVVDAAEGGDAGETARRMVAFAEAAGAILTERDARPAIFQDVYAQGRSFTLDEGPDFIHELATAVRFTQALAPPGHIATARRHMATLFQQQHGVGEGAPALPFLESFAQVLQRAATDPSNSFWSVAERSDDAQAALVSRCFNEGDARHVALSPDWAASVIDARPQPRAASQMCFMQAYSAQGRTHYALNRCHAGWASSFSRFLEPECWAIDPLRDYLGDAAENGGVADLLGWFGFNAADRPDIVERSVSIPPIDDPVSRAEDIAAFTLRHRPEYDDLVLTGPDGRDVTLTYTAILATGAMPRLHMVARMIGANTESVVEPWLPFTQHAPVGEDGIRRCPRIDVGRFTVCRRQLIAPFVDTPGSGIDSPEYHRAFNAWMDREAMPRWLYVTGPDDRIEGGEARRRQKPMPVDRHNPALVSAMHKELSGTKGDVRFVEALPQPGDGAQGAGASDTMAELGVEYVVLNQHGERGA